MSSRFSFIDDEILRENLEHNFIYIGELVLLTQGDIVKDKSNLRKTVILFTGSIIEGLLHYLIEKTVYPLPKKVFKDLEYTYKDVNVLCEINDDKEDHHYVFGRRHKVEGNYNRGANFSAILNFCKKEFLIKKSLYKKIDKVRELRNNIHLAPLEEVDNKYKKSDVKIAFDAAKDLLEIIEKELNKEYKILVPNSATEEDMRNLKQLFLNNPGDWAIEIILPKGKVIEFPEGVKIDSNVKNKILKILPEPEEEE